MAKRKSNPVEIVPIEDNEELYRRFPPDLLQNGRISLDAIEMPDMSVNRSSLSIPQDVIAYEEFDGWGVAGVMVDEVPPELVENGVIRWTFATVPCPCKFKGKMVLSHCEIRGYRDNRHITDVALFPHEVHLRFRTRLRHKLRIRIHPTTE